MQSAASSTLWELVNGGFLVTVIVARDYVLLEHSVLLS